MDKWEYRCLTMKTWGWDGGRLDTENINEELNTTKIYFLFSPL